MEPSKPAVLILCTGNSCRSQMAEGLFRYYAGGRFDVRSAGTEPAEAVHPIAIEVMDEIGIDISRQHPTDVGEYLGKLAVRHLFIVCQEVEQKCPRMFPGMLYREFWPLDDPAAFFGSTTAIFQKFRSVRDELESRIKEWLAMNP